MRIAPPIVIDETTRKELERLSRKRSMASRVVLRSRIVLLAVDGMQEASRLPGGSVSARAWQRCGAAARGWGLRPRRLAGERRWQPKFIARIDPAFAGCRRPRLAAELRARLRTNAIRWP